MKPTIIGSSPIGSKREYQMKCKSKQEIVDIMLTVLIAPGALFIMVFVDGLFDWTGENKMVAASAISIVFWLCLVLSIII